MSKVTVKLETRTSKDNKQYHVIVVYYQGVEFDTIFPSKPIKALLDLESSDKK
jgi:hypothetical protein